MRSIFESTRAYEAWMRKRTDVSKRLLKNKHRKMGTGAFPFLRATFYRWVERWPEVCPGLATRNQDVLLAVGDLHVENFGVWRDSQQRLVWGINDFDDACELAFTSDLVRLAASAVLAADAAALNVSADQVCALLLKGYRAGLRAEGKPILLSDGRHRALVTLTRDTQEDPKKFWKKKLDPKDNPPIDAGELPRGLEHMFRASFHPGAQLAFREQKSPGGLGSLGRRRFTAVETLKNSARDAREAKALVPSALYWHAGQDHMPSQTATLLQHAVRVPDPHFQVHDQWLIRQFAPDIAKIEMPENAGDKRLALAPDLLQRMGQETANIHLGSRSRNVLENLLTGLDHDERWFPTATERMAACTREDHAEWAKRYQE
jgi:Ser/Thr protein kinase RdoA (MazF antagonist)